MMKYAKNLDISIKNIVEIENYINYISVVSLRKL